MVKEEDVALRIKALLLLFVIVMIAALSYGVVAQNSLTVQAQDDIIIKKSNLRVIPVQINDSQKN